VIVSTIGLLGFLIRFSPETEKEARTEFTRLQANSGTT
jgi:hypothetical protein